MRAGLIPQAGTPTTPPSAPPSIPSTTPPSEPETYAPPTVTLALVRSNSGKDITGTVTATPCAGDSISSFSIVVSAGTLIENTSTTGNNGSVTHTIHVTGVKNLALTASATAVGPLGGTTSKSQTVPK